MPEVSDDALFLKNFNIYRKDRMSRGSNTAHGGVFIAIQKSIISREIAIHTCMNDVVAAVFENSTGDSVLLCTIYNPPNDSPYRIPLPQLVNLVRELKALQLENKWKYTIITGDVNFVCE